MIVQPNFTLQVQLAAVEPIYNDKIEALMLEEEPTLREFYEMKAHLKALISVQGIDTPIGQDLTKHLNDIVDREVF